MVMENTEMQTLSRLADELDGGDQHSEGAVGTQSAPGGGSAPHSQAKKISRTAKIKVELAVGLTPEIQAAMEIATDFSGMKPSQYGRQAILEKLVREGYLRHPGFARWENK